MRCATERRVIQYRFPASLLQTTQVAFGHTKTSAFSASEGLPECLSDVVQLLELLRRYDFFYPANNLNWLRAVRARRQAEENLMSNLNARAVELSLLSVTYHYLHRARGSGQYSHFTTTIGPKDG
jgi:hypothetical protein